ncbi:hypothetical protein CH341_14855, partial [Rhodoplanes roseus]
MDLVVSPIAVSLNTQSGGNQPSFTPGQVVDALVMRLIDQTHVQLAVGNSLIDVQTAVPLLQGAHVQLAVRATPDGLRLVLLHPDETGATATGPAATAAARPAHDVSVRTGVDTAPPAATSATSAQAALAQAVRAAAAQQDGLAPLLANLAAAMKLGGIPDAVRTAAAQLLSFRVPTDEPIEPEDVARALSRSGLFLEAGLATGTVPASPAGDMKAALVALKAALAAMARPGDGQDGKLQGFVEASLSGATQAGAARLEAAGAQALYRALAQAVTA